MELLLESKPDSSAERVVAQADNDPIAYVVTKPLPHTKLDLSKYYNATTRGYLVVEGFLLRFNPQLSRPRSAEQAEQARLMGRASTAHLELQGVVCLVHYFNTNVELMARGQTENDFLLVARYWADGWVHHWLLLLEFQGDIATRVTTLCLLVPETYMKVLEEATPRKAQFLLV